MLFMCLMTAKPYVMNVGLTHDPLLREWKEGAMKRRIHLICNSIQNLPGKITTSSAYEYMKGDPEIREKATKLQELAGYQAPQCPWAGEYVRKWYSKCKCQGESRGDDKGWIRSSRMGWKGENQNEKRGRQEREGNRTTIMTCTNAEKVPLSQTEWAVPHHGGPAQCWP